MNKNDILFKGIIEDIFVPFLRFHFNNADDIFDFSKAPVYMDKELAQLFPHDDRYESRYVDKLIKVYTQAGTEEWILCHIEIQGHLDREDFGKRMFKYFVRIFDKYDKPITALAIFTDDNPDYHPKEFSTSFLGTGLVYHFNTYKVFGQSEQELLKSDNPFAVVMLTVLLALKGKQLQDKDLFALKFDLAKRLLAKNFPKETIRSLMNFLKNYVRFENDDFNHKFDKELQILTENTTTMGLEEQIIELAEKKGEKKGIEIGKEKGIEIGKGQGIEIGVEKSIEIISLLKKANLTIEQIAENTNVPVSVVQKIKDSLSKV